MYPKHHSIFLYVFFLPNPATVNEDYLDIDVIITFTSGQNATDDNQQCVSIPILDDNVLEGNETFDLLVSPTPEDENVVNITGQVITVTIEEDNSDCKSSSSVPVMLKGESKAGTQATFYGVHYHGNHKFNLKASN